MSYSSLVAELAVILALGIALLVWRLGERVRAQIATTTAYFSPSTLHACSNSSAC